MLRAEQQNDLLRDFLESALLRTYSPLQKSLNEFSFANRKTNLARAKQNAGFFSFEEFLRR